MKKRILSTVLAVVMVCSLCTNFALAISPSKLQTATAYADELKELGLFFGTDTGYQLENTALRSHAVTMLVRLLNKTGEAETSTYTHPFTDVPQWCDRYVAYAYNNKLTSGTSATTFTPNTTTTPRQYITFVLRALGHSEKTGLTWQNTFDKATELGLISKGEYSDSSEFLRADMVILSYRALSQIIDETGKTLKETVANASTEEKPVEPSKPIETPNQGDFENTQGNDNGEYKYGEAGYFLNQVDDIRPTINLNADYNTNLSAINGFLTNTYTLSYFNTGMGADDDDNNYKVFFKFDKDTQRYGMEIRGWRSNYNSNVSTNNKLNSVLETFLFICGDREVAYALWAMTDDASINGPVNSDNYGFKDVEKTVSGNWVITMNGVNIEVINGKGTQTYWFN